MDALSEKKSTLGADVVVRALLTAPSSTFTSPPVFMQSVNELLKQLNRRRTMRYQVLEHVEVAIRSSCMHWRICEFIGGIWAQGLRNGCA